LKPKPDQHRRRDRDRRPESRCPLNEGAEAEGDQQNLNPPIVSKPRNRLLDDLELAGLDGDVVDKDRRQDDPSDREETKGRPIRRRRQRQLGRHTIDGRRHQHRRAEPDQRGDMRPDVPDGQQAQQD
jgi:hypothetical protein